MSYDTITRVVIEKYQTLRYPFNLFDMSVYM